MNQDSNVERAEEAISTTQNKKTLWQRCVAYLKELTKPTDMPPVSDGYDRYLHRGYLPCGLRDYSELFSAQRMF